MDHINLDKPITEYSRENLIDIFGMMDKDDKGRQALLIRSIIYNEKQFLNQTHYRSLRHFWYNPVKSVLGMLGYLEKQSVQDKPGRRLSQKLSEYIKEMVERGVLTYAKLAISDDSRKFSNPTESHMTYEGYQYCCGKDGYAYCILAVEKDTAYAAIASIASLLGCSAISGKGQDALAAMETLFRNIKDHEKYPGPYGEIHLLSFTDYDPTGYNIHNTFVDHANLIKDQLCPGKEVTGRRVGLTLGQVEPGKVEFAKYPVSRDKPAVFDKWMDETGGIDGEPYGLELDVLSIQEIRSLMVTGIEGIIDEDRVARSFKKDRVKQAVLSYLEPRIEEVVNAVYNQVYEDMEKIDGVLFEKACNGEYHLEPKDLYEIDEDHLHTLVDEEMENDD